MANQHVSALQDAAYDFKDDMKQLGITVLPHTLFHPNRSQQVPPGTTKNECKKYIREFIVLVNQERLL